MAYKHTEETKKKISEIRKSGKTYIRPCIFCNKMFGGGTGIPRKRKFCSRECYLKSGFHSNFMKTHPNIGQLNVGRKKRKNVTCKVCGKVFEVIPSSRQKYCSHKCFRKTISNNLKGKPKSPEHIKKVNKAIKKYWDKRGRKKVKRSYHNVNKKYTIWRTSVFERDNYTCQVCNLKGGKLQAHHIKSWIKYPKLRYEINNGITVCVSCHKQYHKNRK